MAKNKDWKSALREKYGKKIENGGYGPGDKLELSDRLDNIERNKEALIRAEAINLASGSEKYAQASKKVIDAENKGAKGATVGELTMMGGMLPMAGGIATSGALSTGLMVAGAGLGLAGAVVAVGAVGYMFAASHNKKNLAKEIEADPQALAHGDAAARVKWGAGELQEAALRNSIEKDLAFRKGEVQAQAVSLQSTQIGQVGSAALSGQPSGPEARVVVEFADIRGKRTLHTRNAEQMLAQDDRPKPGM